MGAMDEGGAMTGVVNVGRVFFNTEGRVPVGMAGAEAWEWRDESVFSRDGGDVELRVLGNDNVRFVSAGTRTPNSSYGGGSGRGVSEAIS